MDNYYTKYLKYKNKYLELKGIKGNGSINNVIKGGGNDGVYYSKYMKYKTKYIKEGGLVGGELKECDSTGFIDDLSKSVWWFIRNTDCNYNALLFKINNKLDRMTYSDFIRTNKENPAETISIINLKNKRFPAIILAGAKFPLKELKEAGYSASELKEAEFTAKQLINVGFTLEQLKKAEFTLQQLKEAGFSAYELKKEGFTLQLLKEIGFSALELYIAEYQDPKLIEILEKIKILEKINPSIILMNLVNDYNGLFKYDLKHLKMFFSVKEFKDARNYVIYKGVWHGYPQRFNWYTENDLLTAGFTKEQVSKIFNKLNLEQKDSILQLKDLNINASTLYRYGYKLPELKEAGFTLWEIYKAGFTLEELKKAGFTLKKFREAGFGTKDISEIRDKNNNVIHSMLSIQDANTQLKEAGFT